MRQPLGRDADLLESLSGLAWVVGPDLRILDYGRRNWRAQALAGGAPQWAEDARVIGAHVLDVTAGADVRAMYQRILDDVFSGATREVAFGYRCDSPDRQRDMRLAITPVRRNGTVVAALFHSCLMAEDVRPPVNLYDFAHMDEALSASERLPPVAMCSLCQRVRPSGGFWMTAEQYYRAGHPSRVTLSHTLCAACEHEAQGHYA